MVKDKPHYSLGKVRMLAKQENGCRITMRARETARNDFGWGVGEIKRAISKLQQSDFHKSNYKFNNPKIHVDYYKAENLIGEKVYTHFRIEDGVLIIDSFKEI